VAYGDEETRQAVGYSNLTANEGTGMMALARRQRSYFSKHWFPHFVPHKSIAALDEHLISCTRSLGFYRG
jgi:hypothetical protein